MGMDMGMGLGVGMDVGVWEGTVAQPGVCWCVCVCVCVCGEREGECHIIEECMGPGVGAQRGGAVPGGCHHDCTGPP